MVGLIKRQKSGRSSSSSSSSATNRSVDVSNIICLTARVFGFKQKQGGRGGAQSGGGAPPNLLLTCLAPGLRGGVKVRGNLRGGLWEALKGRLKGLGSGGA